MATPLTDADQRLLSELRVFGVLQDVDEHRLSQEEGVILFTCGDGDQMPDIWRFQTSLMQNQRPNLRIHVIAVNGGALLLAKDSPLSQDEERRFLLSQIAGAKQLKHINTVALNAHAPCGMAGLLDLDAERVIDLLKGAGASVREEFPDMQVACFLQVDNGRQRTYFVSGPRLKEWKQRR